MPMPIKEKKPSKIIFLKQPLSNEAQGTFNWLKCGSTAASGWLKCGTQSTQSPSANIRESSEARTVESDQRRFG